MLRFQAPDRHMWLFATVPSGSADTEYFHYCGIPIFPFPLLRTSGQHWSRNRKLLKEQGYGGAHPCFPKIGSEVTIDYQSQREEMGPRTGKAGRDN